VLLPTGWTAPFPAARDRRYSRCLKRLWEFRPPIRHRKLAAENWRHVMKNPAFTGFFNQANR
jgi:hypothetical protein